MVKCDFEEIIRWLLRKGIDGGIYQKALDLFLRLRKVWNDVAEVSIKGTTLAVEES